MSGFGTYGFGVGPWGTGGADTTPPVTSPPATRVRRTTTVAHIDDLGLGIDYDLREDLPLTLRLAGGYRNLANALVRRYTTPRGGLFYDPDYGLDLREYLNADLTGPELAGLPALIALEAQKDERIQRAMADVVYNRGTSTLTVRIAIVTSVGPFKLVLDVSALTVQALAVGA